MSPERSVTSGLIADDGVIIGYPVDRREVEALELGPGAHLRSGTVLYDGSTIGSRLQTGHHVVIREENVIGDDVAVWSNSIIDYGCTIGHRVKIHANCYIAQYSELGDDVFLAPGVTFANDLYPGRAESAERMRGPLVESGAQIGVNATVLPYVTVGRNAIVGAGAVVSRDIPPGAIAFGSPAVRVGSVDDLGNVSSRIDERDRHQALGHMRAGRSGAGGRPV